MQVSRVCSIAFKRMCTSVQSAKRVAKRVAKASHSLFIDPSSNPIVISTMHNYVHALDMFVEHLSATLDVSNCYIPMTKKLTIGTI